MLSLQKNITSLIFQMMIPAICLVQRQLQIIHLMKCELPIVQIAMHYEDTVFRCTLMFRSGPNLIQCSHKVPTN